jgi:hypothetical protein
MAAACVVAIAGGPARAEEGGKISISGILDWYYQYSTNHPGTGLDILGRSFDVKNNSFSLSLGEMNIVRAPSESLPVGFTATLTFGKTADIVHGTEPGGAETYKHIQQLYATYTTTGKTPITIDLGKWVTMHGMEVIESSANDQYSRSFLFTYAIPFYHTGLRLTAPLNDKISAGLYLVNGWNNVEDDNGGKTYGASVTFKPNDKITLVANYMGGDESEGAGLPYNLNVQLLDFVGVVNLTPKLKLGFNVDYASARKSGVEGGNWNGRAFYARYQLSEKSAVALRYEQFEDSAGLRTGIAQNLSSITGTYEYTIGGSLLNRLELRYDKAGKPFFTSASTDIGEDSLVGLNNKQFTITYSQVLKF